MRMAGGQRQWLNQLPNDLRDNLLKAEVDSGTAEMARRAQNAGKPAKQAPNEAIE